MALSKLTKVQTLGIGSNIEVVGVITTGQFKSGTSNLHSTGVDLTNLNVSGIATIGGNLSIGGTLTYQDVTNIDSVGLITARAGVNVSGGQLDVGSNIKLGNAGVITATSFVGSGANLTGITQTTINNNAANRIITGEGGTTLNGEANLTFDGSTLGLSGVFNSGGNVNCTSGRFQRGSATVQDGDAIAGGININGTDMDASVIMSVFGNDNDFTRISGSKSRNASVGSHTIVQNNDVLLSLKGFGSDGTNFEEAAQIEMQVDGTPNNNVMPGRIVFKTTTTDGVVERLRITSAGNIGINRTNPSYPLDIQHVGGNLNQTPILRLFQDSDGCHNAFTLESSTSADKNIGIQFKNRNVVRGGIGYIQSDQIHIYTGTNPNVPQGLIIDGDGNVTKPNMPVASFTDSRATDISNAVLTSSNFYNHQWWNEGNHFNTSTGRFTCPVDGVYRLYFRASEQDTTSTNVRLRKNGNTINEAYTKSGNHSVSSEIVLHCSANDYLEIQANRLKANAGTQHKQVTFQLLH